jgi:hypothetical protein
MSTKVLEVLKVTQSLIKIVINAIVTTLDKIELEIESRIKRRRYNP